MQAENTSGRGKYPAEEAHHTDHSSYTQLALLTDALHEILFRRPKLHPRLQVIPCEQYFHHAGETCTQPEQEPEI